jgi:hypothetical protein
VEDAAPEHEGENEMSSFAVYERLSWNSLDIVNNQIAIDKFSHLNRQARWVNLWNRLTGRPQTLLSYEQMRNQSMDISGVDHGVQEILVKSIIGSLLRSEDFDRQFRPLNPALKDRWISIHMLTEHSGWGPIIVNKIGDLYFVVDGHHRVSVARHSGWKYIEAHVYE